MKFEEIQRKWDSIDCEPKSDDELRRMMYSTGWRLRGLTEKEFIRLSFLVLFAAIIVIDGVGNWKLEVSGLLGTIQLLNHYFGLRYLWLLPHRETFQQTLVDALARIKRLALISNIVNALTWIALALIIAMNVQMGMLNIILWTVMLLPILGAIAWWNARSLSRKRNEVNSMLKEFEENFTV